MKEIYAWAPYFRELARKVADGGERHLIDTAKRVAWKQEGPRSPLLNYGDQNIDPFSFFYTIAANSPAAVSRTRIYESLRVIYDMDSELPIELDEAFVFPTPPRINTLFHSGGQGDPALLWRLFRSAVSGFEHLDAGDFGGALAIGNVALKKLTQTLFLINADSFLPIDDHTTSLGLFRFDKPPNRVTLAEYANLIELMRNALPGCHLFEINLFAYLRSTGLAVRPGHCFQISTNVYDEAQDHWSDFRDGNSVFTGGPGQNNRYPLGKPEPGDVVLVRYGRRQGRGVAVVHRNDYREGGWAEDRKLHVLWLNKMSASLRENAPVIGFSEAGPSTRHAFRNADAYAATFELLERLSPAETERSPADVRVEHPRNRILYGPPGTGKTWHAVNHALAIVDGTEVHARIERERFDEFRFEPKEGSGRIAMVTFHQNFAYEDFIEGIRPALDRDNIAYKMHDGIFKLIAKAAEKQPNRRFVLIIDEINRGNIAKIFGELITLIEDSRRIGRDDQTLVTLPYSGETFSVPDNLYLIGTMNTADRSIQLLDTALRRRFTFIEMMPNPRHEGVATDIDGVDCTRMLAAINERISAMLDREHQIGHTYLLHVHDMNQLAEAFRNRIFPLLQEYFFDDWAKIRAVLANNAFVAVHEVQGSRALTELLDEDRKLYERLPNDDSAWRDSAEYKRIYEADDADEPEHS